MHVKAAVLSSTSTAPFVSRPGFFFCCCSEKTWSTVKRIAPKDEKVALTLWCKQTFLML